MLPVSLFLFFGIYALPPTPAPVTSDITSPAPINLLSDSRLQKHITIRAKGVALRDLLEQWEKEIGVPLSADRYTAEQKLQMNLRERPVGDALSGIAELLQGEWKADKGQGYRLVRSPEAVDYAKEWWKRYDRERERTRQLAVQWAMKQMNRYKPGPGALETLEAKDDTSLINGFHNSRFWSDLPVPMQQAIAERYQDRSDARLPALRSSNGKSALPYKVTAVSSGNAIPFRFADLSVTSQESLQYSLANMQPNYKGQPIQNVVISVSGYNSTVVAILNDGRKMETGNWLYVTPENAPPSLSLDHHDLAASIAARGGKPSKDAVVLLAYQKQTVWENGNLPKASEETCLPRLPDVLAHYAKETDSEYLADYYSLPYRPLTQAEWHRKIPDADTELRSLAVNYDVSFRKSRGIILVRNNRWYRNDVLEAPSRVTKRLEKAAATPPIPPTVLDKRTAGIYAALELAALVAQEATEYQIANSLYYGVEEERMPAPEMQTEDSLRKSRCQPLLHAADSAFHHYAVLRFYSTLAVDQQTAILSTGIPLHELSPATYEQLSKIEPLLPATGLLRLSCTNFGFLPVVNGTDGRRININPYQFGTSPMFDLVRPRLQVVPIP